MSFERRRASVPAQLGRADVAQSVEHSLGKGEVTGSIPVISSIGLVVGRAGVTQW